jgi:transcriptional regulator with XRE-family HTH domain
LVTERSFGPVVVRRRLGAELRRLRDRAGLSLEQAARELEVSPSKISRLENGLSPAKVWDVRNLLTLYGVEDDDYRRRAERWVSEGKSEGWWHPYSDATPGDLDHYISLEAEAAEIQAYCSVYLNGLLQTRDYAHALLEATLSDLEPAVVDGLVDIRMRRQEIFFASDREAHLRVVLDEAALRRRVGSVETMAAQWQHVLDLTEEVEIRVRTLDAGPHMALYGPFTVFVPRERDVDPAVVNLESAFRDAYWDDPAEVSRFVRSFEDLEASSLLPSDSAEFISALLREG